MLPMATRWSMWLTTLAGADVQLAAVDAELAADDSTSDDGY
jgi:hypothetical protein